MLKGPIFVGSLLVFVDTIKELPITFILRPFDFDTLSVRIYQYAGDERMAEAILPASLHNNFGFNCIKYIDSKFRKKILKSFFLKKGRPNNKSAEVDNN